MGESMSDKVLLVMAEEDTPGGQIVAGALNLIGSDALYGRNWGCAYGSTIKNLHFELCYYQVCHHRVVTTAAHAVVAYVSTHSKYAMSQSEV